MLHCVLVYILNLNTDNGYFHIKIMISAAHMLGVSWACSLRRKLEKNATWCVLMFLCIPGPPRQVPSHPFFSYLAYYMGAPSDQFLRIEYGGPLRSVSSLIMEASLCLFFFHAIWGPLRSFLCILYWGLQITFFAYYGGLLMSVFFHTI